MSKSKCGCPDCRHQPVPHTRAGWKSRKNQHGNIYGSYKNGNAKHGGGNHQK